VFLAGAALQLSGTFLVLVLRPDVAFADGNLLRLSVGAGRVRGQEPGAAGRDRLAGPALLGSPPAAPPRRLAAARDPVSETPTQEAA
jgi:hypothetical protein